MLDRIRGWFDPGVLGGVQRSPDWRKVRAKHLEDNPKCVVCGGTKKVQVHHVMPFHLHPELELEPDNLVSLCVAKKYGINCHLLAGHRGSYRRENVWINSDVDYLNLMLSKYG